MGSFDEFVRGNLASLHATAWLICGNREDARDLVQSALLVLYRRWDRLAPGNLRGYAITVMANEWRRSTRRGLLRLHAERQAAPDCSFDVEYRDDRDSLAHYLARLGPRQRAAVILRVVEDMAEGDVARLLGCSPGTVRSQTSRALAAMRAAIAADAAAER